MINTVRPGDIVDIAIKGVRVVNEREDGTVVVKCDDERAVWPMPPQAAVILSGSPNPIDAASLTEGISKVLAFLDSLEAETYIQPYVATGVRKALGLPPRQWPPQPGDVWDDGYPFGGSLWFARQYQAGDDNQEWPSRIVMTSVEGGNGIKSPPDLLEYAVELRLAYRKDGGQ